MKVSGDFVPDLLSTGEHLTALGMAYRLYSILDRPEGTVRLIQVSDQRRSYRPAAFSGNVWEDALFVQYKAVFDLPVLGNRAVVVQFTQHGDYRAVTEKQAEDMYGVLTFRHEGSEDLARDWDAHFRLVPEQIAEWLIKLADELSDIGRLAEGIKNSAKEVGP